MGRGRPRVEFQDAKERTQRRVLGELHKTESTKKLVAAAEFSLRKNRMLKESTIVHASVSSSPGTLFKVAKNQTPENPVPLNCYEGLALILDSDLSVQSYKDTRDILSIHGFKALPSYHEVLLAKKSCYPENIYVSGMEFSIPLQNLLDHTVQRILIY